MSCPRCMNASGLCPECEEGLYGERTPGPVSLSRFDDDVRTEEPINMLPAGTRFCLHIPACWGYPSERLYGEVVFVNASRARVMLVGRPKVVEFGDRVFESKGIYESNLPTECTVEPIAWQRPS
jgi:hypothetical protein